MSATAVGPTRPSVSVIVPVPQPPDVLQIRYWKLNVVKRPYGAENTRLFPDCANEPGPENVVVSVDESQPLAFGVSLVNSSMVNESDVTLRESLTIVGAGRPSVTLTVAVFEQALLLLHARYVKEKGLNGVLAGGV